MGADAWGVADGYMDGSGQWRLAPEHARSAIRAAYGADRPHAPGDPLDDAVRVVLHGERALAGADGDLTAEDGGVEAVHSNQDLGQLPVGIYHLARGLLLVAPPTCPTPSGHQWGWAVQVYALWSRRSGGIGDLRDLAAFGTWAASPAGGGAGMVLCSPFHAPAPSRKQQPSPYFPSSRVFRNPLHLGVGPSVRPIRPLDRDAVWRVKRGALWAAWSAADHTRDPAFERFRAEQGDALVDFGTHCALVEHFEGSGRGSDWRAWPDAFRHPHSVDVRRFASGHPDLVGFFAWIQFRIDQQLAEAASAIGLITDLAVGVDRSGADAWIWQDRYCLDLSVGAPPDVFNAAGQDWGLPPYDPWRLRLARYDAFRRTVRAATRHARGIRIDHVMGLFRLWLIAAGERPTAGCYAYLPFHEYLAIVAIEAHRTGAFVVGEDLGTVEPYVRDELARRQILSYKLLPFEPGPVEALPALALAASTTHDLPTLAGAWTGSDAETQRALGRPIDEDDVATFRRELAARACVTEDVPTEVLIDGVHRQLAGSPCAIVTATLEDALGLSERPNVPGTIDEWPNWRIPLPLPLEEVVLDAGIGRTQALFTSRSSSNAEVVS